MCTNADHQQCQHAPEEERLSIGMAVFHSELRCVQEAQNPRQPLLREPEKDRAYDRDGHHEVEVHEQVGPELREALHDGRAQDTLARVLPERSRNL